METPQHNSRIQDDGAVSSVIENRSDASLYKQIYLILRTRILNGEYPNQSVLPGEMEMARQFGVSRITAKRALNDLAAEGLCLRKRGIGSIVTFKPSAGPLQADVQGLLEFLSHVNLNTKATMLNLEYLSASKKISEILKVPIGTEIQRSTRMRIFEGKPFSYLDTYVPADLGRSMDQAGLGARAALTLLEEQGVKVTNAEQTITATLADTAVAEVLDISPGSPLLRIARVVFDDQSRVVEYIVGLYRPDRFEYRMLLSRVSDGGAYSWTSL